MNLLQAWPSGPAFLYEIDYFSLCLVAFNAISIKHPPPPPPSPFVVSDSLVTSCHECRIHLTSSQADAENQALPVEDIVDLVYEAAGMVKH